MTALTRTYHLTLVDTWEVGHADFQRAISQPSMSYDMLEDAVLIMYDMSPNSVSRHFCLDSDSRDETISVW
jgi:hypothetical protein